VAAAASPEALPRGADRALLPPFVRPVREGLPLPGLGMLFHRMALSWLKLSSRLALTGSELTVAELFLPAIPTAGAVFLSAAGSVFLGLSG